MAHVATHLSVEELEARLRAAPDAKSARHFQAIWLLAKGHAIADVSSTTAFGIRWLEKLVSRYNAQGPDALGDLRRHNGTSRTILTQELLDRLRVRLAAPPPDRGLWTSRKVAVWMAGELGLASVAVQRSTAPLSTGGVASDRVVDPNATARASRPSDTGRARSI